MSEKKNALAETALAAAGEEPKPGQPDGQRPRGQNVLPDILGKQLRAAYGELLNSPVPDRFNDLIKKLEHREAEDAKSSTSQDEEASQ
jgi:hypothetical protein